MGVNKKHINKVNQENIDDWMSSLGFTYPKTEKQLNRFNKFFKDYDYKLNDAKIDYEAIFNKSPIKRKVKTVNLYNPDFKDDVSDLKMVARKGQKNLPKHIIDKMKKKHNKPNNEQ